MTDPIDKYNNVVLITNPYQSVDIYGSMDIDDGTYDRNGWVTSAEVAVEGFTGSRYSGSYYMPYDNADNSHYIVYNNFGVISDGTNYEYVDVKITPHSYLTDAEKANKYAGLGFNHIPQSAGDPTIVGDSIGFWIYAQNNILDVSITYSDGYLDDTNENNYQDGDETIIPFGYTNAGSIIDGGANFYFADLDGTNYVAIEDSELEKMRIPYCDVADIPISLDGGLTIDTTNPCYQFSKEYQEYTPDGTDYPHLGGAFYDILSKKRSTLTDLDFETQRLKVYFDSSVPGTTKHVLLDSWASNSENNISQNFQLQTVDGEFQLETGFQHKWWGYNTTTEAIGGAGMTLNSVETEIVTGDKKQTDAGVGFDNTTGAYGEGALDGVAAPNESILYTISVTNAGYVTDENYTVTDTIADEFEDIDFTNVNVVSMTLSDYEGFELAGEIPPVGQMCSSVTCTTLSEGTDYTIDKTDPRKINVTLTTPIEQQTAYLVQFEVKVKADYGGLSDNAITNTAQICDSTASCFTTPEITLPYGDIALKIDKSVNDNVDSAYSPSEGIAANEDTYASSEEWLNYTITITNKASDGAKVPAQNVNLVDDITLDTNLEKIDPTTILITSSTDGDITISCDTTLTTATLLNVTIPTIEVDETITITFKAQAL